MGFFDRMRNLFDPDSPDGAPTPAAKEDRELTMKRAAGWLAAMESGKLSVPQDAHDAEAWDRYWMAQIEFGAIEVGFGDMMASDSSLIATLIRREARTILCAGNGLSSEPVALALHGFDVTALDLSTIPRAVFRAMLADTSHQLHSVPGLTVLDEASVAFNHTGPIDPEVCPGMHKTESHSPQGGGSLTYVSGDLSNQDICPGPFNVVIERRTVQLFPETEQPAALAALEARLTARGLFVSHQHRGAWRPGDSRDHYAAAWVKAHGFVSHASPAADSAERVAQLFYSTG